MKIMKVFNNASNQVLGGLFAVLLGFLSISVAHAQIFVTSYLNGTIGEYTTSGGTVSASLISGLNYPYGIAVSGSNLFVANPFNNTIGEYTTSGGMVTPSLISGLIAPTGIAVSGSNLFVASQNIGSFDATIGEYTTSGGTVNASLISGLTTAYGIAVAAPVPEPSTYALMLAGLGLIGFITYRRKNETSNMMMAV